MTLYEWAYVCGWYDVGYEERREVAVNGFGWGRNGCSHVKFRVALRYAHKHGKVRGAGVEKLKPK